MYAHGKMYTILRVISVSLLFFYLKKTIRMQIRLMCVIGLNFNQTSYIVSNNDDLVI